MLQAANDLKVMDEGFDFETSLPKSFVALLVSSLEKYGVTVKDIRDRGDVREIHTSHGVARMKGSFSSDNVMTRLLSEQYRVLNKRFDDRVERIKAKGLSYFKEHTCFATSEMRASNGLGITNSAIMHMDDFMFNMTLDRI